MNSLVEQVFDKDPNSLDNALLIKLVKLLKEERDCAQYNFREANKGYVQAQSKYHQREVQLKKALDDLAAEKALREQAEAALKKSNGMLQMAIDAGVASEAAGAEMRDIIQRVSDDGMCSCSDAIAKSLLNEHQHASICVLHKALSTSFGKAFLDERERHVKALERIASCNPAASVHPPGTVKLIECPAIAREALKEAK